jgi:hypothetical protein
VCFFECLCFVGDLSVVVFIREGRLWVKQVDFSLIVVVRASSFVDVKLNLLSNTSIDR